MSTTQQDAINKLIDMSEKYNGVIEFETQNVATMQEQIKIVRQKIHVLRETMGGVNASKENVYLIQKQVRILENRLDKALLKYNEAVAGNKQLRDTIDDLRRERVVFESIYRKMERQLQERKQQMASIIESSNQSYEQRDAYQMEIAAIEQANRKEEEEFSQQCAELSRMLDNELRLPTNPLGRGKTLGSPSRSVSEAQLSNLKSTAPPIPAVRPMTSGTATLTSAADTSTTRMQNFEEAFNKIKAATGITDIDELVRNFIKNEDRNFSLFNYVSEQNSEVERLEEAIHALREEEKKYSQESGEDVDSHKLLLKELEVKIQSKEGAAERYEEKSKAQMKVIESLKRGIHSIYYKFELFACNNEEELLRDSARLKDSFVTESNMVHYLGEIEQKTNRLLVEYAAVKEKLAQPIPFSSHSKSGRVDERREPSLSPAKMGVSLLGTGPKVPMGKDSLVVNPPKLDEYLSEEEDSEDEDARPLTRDELKNKTLNLLQRKGQNVPKSRQPSKKASNSVKTMASSR